MIMCIFNCGMGNCKTGAQHHCRSCGAKDAVTLKLIFLDILRNSQLFYQIL